MTNRIDKRGKMRNYFLTLENNSKNLEKLENIEENFDIGKNYIQMVLPVKRITKKLENILKENVDHNILRAQMREVKEKDFEIFMNLYNKAWLTSHEPFRALTIGDLKSLYHAPNLIMFIANVFGIDAGFMILDFEGPEKQFGIIVAVGVIPRFQRKGLGKIMALAAWELFKKRNVVELRSEVYINNNISHNFLKSLGFEDNGIILYKLEDYDLTISKT